MSTAIGQRGRFHMVKVGPAKHCIDDDQLRLIAELASAILAKLTPAGATDDRPC
jgi:hypothetical protein